MRDPDLGLFGPDSVSWRLHAEPILWMAGFRALLLQTLHPRALAGVLQNSNFREDPWGRLFRTARFYGDVVYGSTDVARRAGARVRGLHSRLSATDPGTGEAFRVDDPELLLWVYVTATESFCTTALRGGLALSDADVRRYYEEQRAVAELVGLEPESVPATPADIEAYYERVRPQLRADADARATARYLALPAFPLGLGWTPIRPMWIGVAAYGYSLLPPWARRLYGMSGPPLTDLTATLTTRALRLFAQTRPRNLLEGPIYRAAKRRAAQAVARSTAVHDSLPGRAEPAGQTRR
jgi:uncharacterized protein (DUF2236 family)